MIRKCNRRPNICLISSIPLTLWSFYRLLPDRLKAEGFNLEVCSSPGKELDYFKKQCGISFHEVNIHRQITLWKDVLAILKLVRIFTRSNFDLVHAHTPKAGVLGMIAASLAGVRYRVYTCHGLPLETESLWKRELLAWAERVSCALAHRVLAVSYSLVGKLRAYNICSRSKLAVLGDGSACGVELSRFTPSPDLLKESSVVRRRHNISDDNTVIGFIGRLVPDKGIHILVESFIRVYEIYPNVRLLVLGDFEPHRGQLPDEAIKDLNRHPGIIHVGFTPRIESYYAAMDMLVLPSRREGFPYALLEAAAMRLPVIATKVTGCVDAVVDGQTGILIPPENVAALTDAIGKMISSPRLREQMGRIARERIEKKFSSERLLDAHVKLYKQLLNIW